MHGGKGVIQWGGGAVREGKKPFWGNAASILHHFFFYCVLTLVSTGQNVVLLQQ